MSADKDYFEDLLQEFEEDPKEPELTEEEQRQKNKDAEEARKRREAEAKAKEEAEKEVATPKEDNSEAEAQKAEAEAAAQKAEEEAKAKADAEAKKQASKTNQLGEQLLAFKTKYPDVDLATLDKDTNFKRYIDGKILGKKDFVGLYEDYIDFTSSISGRSQDELRKNYEKKAQASSGSSKPKGEVKPKEEVYTEDELTKIAARIPLMNDKEAKKILEKFERSVEYYKNNK